MGILLDKHEQRKGPRLPFIILDRTSTICYVSPRVQSLVGYAKWEIQGKAYLDFLSSDLYEAALVPLAYCLDRAVLEAQNDEKVRIRRIENRKELYERHNEHVRTTFAPQHKVRSVRKLIADFERSKEEEFEQLSQVRLKKKDGTAISLEDTLTLHKFKSGWGREYAGMVVTLTPTETMWEAIFRVGKGFKRMIGLGEPEFPEYEINGEYVLPIMTLSQAGSMPHYLFELVRSPRDQKLVVDLSFVNAVQSVCFDGLWGQIGPQLQEGNVIFGNVNKEFRLTAEAQAKKDGVKLNFNKLVYPQIKEPTLGQDDFRLVNDYEALDGFISSRLSTLEGYIANSISRKSLQKVQPDPERKSDDVQADR